jgi:uncharacterized delta-60 repeat protein
MRVLIFSAMLLLARIQGFSQAGSLDGSFNGTGSVQTLVGPISSGGGGASVVAIQPADQKILVAGAATSPDGYTSFAVIRYLPNGTLDAGFGNGGIAIISVGENTYGATGMAIQPDGKIVLVGQFLLIVGDNAYTFGSIMRLTTSGTLDNSFADGGEENVLNLGASGVVLQTNGDIIVGGTYKKYIGVMRFSSNGTQDMTYGGNGVSTFDADPDYDDAFNGMAIQPNGRVVVVGMSSTSTNEIMVARLTTSGSADQTFGTKGKMYFTVGNNDELLSGNGVAIQSDGKILVNGSYRSANGNYPMLIVRLNTDGTLDNSFAGNGKKGIVIGDLCYAAGLAIQSNGKIVSVGAAGPESGPLSFVMVRLNASDGSLDASFGQGGIVNTVFGNGTSDATGVAIQANGRIVVTGAAEATSGTTEYGLFTTVRYLASGTAGSATNDELTEGRATGLDSASSTNVHIYPNPAISTLRVDGLDANVTTALIVRDASGRVVLTARTERQPMVSLDINSLPAGAYFLEVQGGEKRRSFVFVKGR